AGAVSGSSGEGQRGADCAESGGPLAGRSAVVLQQEQQDGYEFCRKQMAECDWQLNHYLEQSEDRSQGAPLAEEKRKGRLKKKKGNAPQFDLREGLFRL